AKIQERADRLKIEREAQKRAAELKRAAQRATQSSAKQVRKPPAEEVVPSALRGIRVVRNGKVVGDDTRVETKTERSGPARSRDQSAGHEIKVGDRVRLASFGSIGVIDSVKDDEAEVRIGSLHLREK